MIHKTLRYLREKIFKSSEQLHGSISEAKPREKKFPSTFALIKKLLVLVHLVHYIFKFVSIC